MEPVFGCSLCSTRAPPNADDGSLIQGPGGSDPVDRKTRHATRRRRPYLAYLRHVGLQFFSRAVLSVAVTCPPRAQARGLQEPIETAQCPSHPPLRPFPPLPCGALRQHVPLPASTRPAPTWTAGRCAGPGLRVSLCGRPSLLG